MLQFFEVYDLMSKEDIIKRLLIEADDEDLSDFGSALKKTSSGAGDEDEDLSDFEAKFDVAAGAGEPEEDEGEPRLTTHPAWKTTSKDWGAGAEAPEDTIIDRRPAIEKYADEGKSEYELPPDLVATVFNHFRNRSSRGKPMLRGQLMDQIKDILKDTEWESEGKEDKSKRRGRKGVTGGERKIVGGSTVEDDAAADLIRLFTKGKKDLAPLFGQETGGRYVVHPRVEEDEGAKAAEADYLKNVMGMGKRLGKFDIPANIGPEGRFAKAGEKPGGEPAIVPGYKMVSKEKEKLTKLNRLYSKLMGDIVSSKLMVSPEEKERAKNVSDALSSEIERVRNTYGQDHPLGKFVDDMESRMGGLPEVLGSTSVKGAVDYNTKEYTVPALRELASERGVDIRGLKNKADIANALSAAGTGQEGPTEEPPSFGDVSADWEKRTGREAEKDIEGRAREKGVPFGEPDPMGGPGEPEGAGAAREVDPKAEPTSEEGWDEKHMDDMAKKFRLMGMGEKTYGRRSGPGGGIHRYKDPQQDEDFSKDFHKYLNDILDLYGNDHPLGQKAMDHMQSISTHALDVEDRYSQHKKDAPEIEPGDPYQEYPPHKTHGPPMPQSTPSVPSPEGDEDLSDFFAGGDEDEDLSDFGSALKRTTPDKMRRYMRRYMKV